MTNNDAVPRALLQVANAITPLSAAIAEDATGGSVGSLTEATMGVTAALCSIADAINNLADAVRESAP